MRYLPYFILLFLVSCSVSPDHKALSEAVRLMDSKPDSALSILNSIEKDANHYNTGDRMSFFLLKAEAMNKSFAPMDTVQFMPKVLDYYKSHGNHLQLMNANYLMGCVYRDRGNSPVALGYYLKAVSITDSSDKREELELLARIYGQIAILFHQQRIPYRELGAWQKCMSYSLLCGDTLSAIQAIEHEGFAYTLMNKKDSAIIMAENAFSYYRRIGKINYAASSLGPIIAYYIDRDSLNKAKEGIDYYIAFSGLFNSKTGVKKGNEMFYHILGRYYEKKGQLDSAEVFYRKLISSATDISSKESGYHGLLSVFSSTQNSDSIVKYASLFAEANDSANIKHSADEINRTQALYDYSESQKLARYKANEASNLKIIVLSLFFIFCIVFLLAYNYLRHLRQRKDNEIRTLNSNYSEALTKYSMALRERKNLESNLAKVKADKDSEISELKKILSTFSDFSNKESWNAEQLLIDHEIVLRIHKHAAKGTILPANEWNDLMGIIEKILPYFFNFISRSELSLSLQEKVLCVLTRLHFIPTEIATLLGLKKQRISNLRRALNKKLFNQEGSKTFTANIYRIKDGRK